MFTVTLPDKPLPGVTCNIELNKFKQIEKIRLELSQLHIEVAVEVMGYPIKKVRSS